MLNIKRLQRSAIIYLGKKDRETAIKKREEYIKQFVKAIMLDRTPKQAIEMLNDITSGVNERLDEKLRESLESVQCISQHKKLKK